MSVNIGRAHSAFPMSIGKAQLAILMSVVALLTAHFFFPAEAGRNEPRLIIMGDSLSTTHEGWPNFLREIAPRWDIHVMAQNGRSIRDFSIPRDLWTNGEKNETVVYFLGANDILQCNFVDHAKYRLETHLNLLLERNFKVLLIVPPTLDVNEERFAKPMAEHRAMIERFRGYHPNLTVYDMDEVWDNTHTMDGIHPDAELSREIAMAINMVLAMNIY
jgi:hypothetical protein